MKVRTVVIELTQEEREKVSKLSTDKYSNCSSCALKGECTTLSEGVCWQRLINLATTVAWKIIPKEPAVCLTDGMKVDRLKFKGREATILSVHSDSDGNFMVVSRPPRSMLSTTYHKADGTALYHKDELIDIILREGE